MTNGSTRFKVVGLGELLWDLFPDGKQLGGALVAQVMKNDGIEHLFGLVDARANFVIGLTMSS